eukprot:Clim_evm8s6 gene=Clim_evmTU8s6
MSNVLAIIQSAYQGTIQGRPLETVSSVNIPAVIPVLAVAYVTYRVALNMIDRTTKAARHAQLVKIANGARAERDAKHDKMVRMFKLDERITAAERKILESTAMQILDALEKKELTAKEVMRAFCKQSVRANRELLAVTEEFYDEAMEAAEEADKLIQSGRWKRSELPLLGLPISVKDQYQQKGALSTCGLAVRAQTRDTEDGVLVGVLRKRGAIPFVRSNVPQSLMLPESVNLIWGESKNPWDLKRTPGGSSGGEGSLVGGRASPLGLGTDIAGSIRIPAAYNGIYGMRPTPTRSTCYSMRYPHLRNISGNTAVLSAAGPLAKSVEDMKLVLEPWLSDPEIRKLDPFIPDVPWREDVYTGKKGKAKLRIGFCEDMYEVFHACETAKRAVREVKTQMKKLGHECVDFKIPNTKEIQLTLSAVLSADGNMRWIKKGAEGEDLHEYYGLTDAGNALPRWVRPIVVQMMKLLGQERMARVFGAIGIKTVDEHWEDIKDKKQYQEDIVRAFDAADIDVLISPALALPAVPLGMSKNLLPTYIYMFYWNLMHWPAGVAPVTRIRANEAHYNNPDAPQDMLTKAAKKVMKGSEGLPMSVQVVARPFQDELIMRVMADIEKTIDFKDEPAWM